MLPAVPEPAHPPNTTPPPELARLALSTSATAAVLGVAVGAAEQSVILGIVFAVVGAGVRLAVAAWRKVRALPVEQIDPFALPEPWRGLVQQALDSGKRFKGVAQAWPAGPLQDRLTSLGPVVEAEVRGVWVAAQQGATLTGGYPAGSKRINADDLSAELIAVQQERSELAAVDQARRGELDRAEEALAAQLQAVRRSKSTAHAVEERLRNLVASLDDAVTSVVALTAGPGGASDVEGAAATVEGLAQEIAALQAGMGEAAQLPRAAGEIIRAPGGPSTPGAGAPSPPPTP